MEIKEGLKRIGRNNEVKLKLGKVELEKIQGKAEKLGLKVSQYIRMCSLNAQIE